MKIQKNIIVAIVTIITLSIAAPIAHTWKRNQEGQIYWNGYYKGMLDCKRMEELLIQ
jgi:hypothetical protein